MNTPNFLTLKCLVVGAASGVGQRALTRLNERAEAVIGADLNSDGEGNLIPIDVTDLDSVERTIRKARAQMGGLDVVINTAGVIGPTGPSHELSPEQFEQVLRINLTGAFNISRSVLPQMAEAGFGRLVHFSSTAGKEGVAGMAAYSAAKAGIMGLVKSIAREYAATGVTVNAVAPGKLETPLLKVAPAAPEDIARIPMQRLGTVDEAAALLEYIISPEASYTTGQIFDLSGGRATW